MDSKERLNQLGEQWFDAKKRGLKNEQMNIQSEVFLLIVQLFPKRLNAISDFFLSNWENFSPEKGDLYSFCSMRLYFRDKDQASKDLDKRRRYMLDSETEQRIKTAVQPLSLQQKVLDDGNTEWQDQLTAPERDAPEANVFADSKLVQLLTLMLRLPQELKGRANNPQKLSYYRMFFTDSIADIAQTMDEISSLEERERDLFQVLHLPFLDFFQIQICRTVAQLRVSCSKPYGKLVPGRPMADPGHPLPNDVYCAYLEQQENIQVGNSALSNQRTAYRQLLGEYLC